MKKRIIYYLVLVLFVVGLFVFNYSSVQDCNKIQIESIIQNDDTITVEGKLRGNYRSVRSVTSEKAGNSFYIKIEAVNDFFSPKGDFKVIIPNKNNSVEKVYLHDKKNPMVIFINSDFGKSKSNFNVKEIINKTGN